MSKIQLTIQVTYKITDYNGGEIQGSFDEQELQKTNQDIFRITKIIKQQGNKSPVKWLDYNDSFNSLVDNKTLTNYRAKVQCSQLSGLAFTSSQKVRLL